MWLLTVSAEIPARWFAVGPFPALSTKMLAWAARCGHRPSIAPSYAGCGFATDAAGLRPTT